MEGQTVDRVVVDLECAQWTAAALYVACSRVRTSEHLRFLPPSDEARERLLALEFEPSLVRWWYDNVRTRGCRCHFVRAVMHCIDSQDWTGADHNSEANEAQGGRHDADDANEEAQDDAEEDDVYQDAAATATTTAAAATADDTTTTATTTTTTTTTTAAAAAADHDDGDIQQDARQLAAR